MRMIPRRRRWVRFRPLLESGGDRPAPLEPRRLLSAAMMTAAHAHVQMLHAPPQPHPRALARAAKGASHRVGPKQEINKQYAQFYANFQLVEASYVRSLNQTSSGTTSVSTTLTANYPSGSVTMQVADAGIFGPEGLFPTPVTANALVGGIQVGTFTLTGSSGNQLIIDPTQSSAVSLGTGTTLNAQVTTSTATSAQAIFPSYISASAQQMAVNLVAYFNSLPIKLPRMYAPPHQSQRAGAIQQYVYQLVAGSNASSLEQSLLAVALPQTPASDLRIYDATIRSAIEASRTQMLSGVKQIFAGKLPVIPPGFTGSSGSTSTGSTSTGTTSTSTGGGSTTTGGGSTTSGGA